MTDKVIDKILSERLSPVCGVYLLNNHKRDATYIGRSVDTRMRIKTHIRKLRHGTHENHALQMHWNIDGEESFSFTLFQICSTQDEAAYYEQYAYDLFRCSNLYNRIKPALLDGRKDAIGEVIWWWNPDEFFSDDDDIVLLMVNREIRLGYISGATWIDARTKEVVSPQYWAKLPNGPMVTAVTE